MKVIPDELAGRLRTHADTFLQQGDQARLDDLAVDLGIARTTLYYYFAGRDDLTTFFMNDKIAAIGAAVRETADETLPPPTQLEQALRAIIANLSQAPMVCLHLSAAQSRPNALQEMTSALTEQVIAPLRDMLTAGHDDGSVITADVDTAISFILGGINRAVACQHRDNGTRDDFDDTIVDLVMTGLRP